jgi:hypothetical protein
MVVSAAIVVIRISVFAEDGFVIPSLGAIYNIRNYTNRSKEGLNMHYTKNVSKKSASKQLIEDIVYSVNHLLATSSLVVDKE